MADSDDENVDHVIPPDNVLRQREQNWLRFFEKYTEPTDEDNVSLTGSDLSLLGREPADDDSDAESVSPDVFVYTGRKDDEDSETNGLNAKKVTDQVKQACQRRKDQWAANGFDDSALPDFGQLKDAGDNRSWLATSLLPSAVSGHVNRSLQTAKTTTTTMTTTETLFHSFTDNGNIQMQATSRNTETKTTIVERVIVTTDTSKSVTPQMDNGGLQASSVLRPGRDERMDNPFYDVRVRLERLSNRTFDEQSCKSISSDDKDELLFSRKPANVHAVLKRQHNSTNQPDSSGQHVIKQPKYVDNTPTANERLPPVSCAVLFGPTHSAQRNDCGTMSISIATIASRMQLNAEQRLKRFPKQRPEELVRFPVGTAYSIHWMAKPLLASATTTYDDDSDSSDEDDILNRFQLMPWIVKNCVHTRK